jgi:hypothetical protein
MSRAYKNRRKQGARSLQAAIDRQGPPKIFDYPWLNPSGVSTGRFQSTETNLSARPTKEHVAQAQLYAEYAMGPGGIDRLLGTPTGRLGQREPEWQWPPGMHDKKPPLVVGKAIHEAYEAYVKVFPGLAIDYAQLEMRATLPWEKLHEPVCFGCGHKTSDHKQEPFGGKYCVEGCMCADPQEFWQSGLDLYTAIAALASDGFYEDVTKEQRQATKRAAWWLLYSGEGLNSVWEFFRVDPAKLKRRKPEFYRVPIPADQVETVEAELRAWKPPGVETRSFRQNLPPRSAENPKLDWDQQRRVWNAEGYCSRVACGRTHGEYLHKQNHLAYCARCTLMLNKAQGEGTVTAPDVRTPGTMGCSQRHEHDCDTCIFLGNADYEGTQYDLYLCPKSAILPNERYGSAIARYGTAGDYVSFDGSVGGEAAARRNPFLRIALQLAEERHLLPARAPTPTPEKSR